MSQQQNPQKGNFLQTFLIVTTLFLGYQLFFGNKQKSEDRRSSAEILKVMRKYDLEKNDPALTNELPNYEKKVQQESEKNNLSTIQKDEQQLYGVMLAAHSQYSEGMSKNNSEKLTAAYTTLYSKERSLNDSPLWKKTFFIDGATEFPSKNISPEELYLKISIDLQSKNKTQKIFGFFPGYQFIDSLVHLTGANPGFSYALAALLVALIVRVLVWPLSQKTFMHSRQMSQLTPLINELKEKYQGVELNQKVMEIHKEYGINPASGCLPALAQIPLFILVYQSMLHYRFEFKNGTFLWINNSFSDATNGWIAPNLGEQDYILIVLYGISMIATTLLTPMSDPVNGKQQRMTGVLMGIFFSVMMFFWVFPSAFILYWIFTNILTTVQTLRSYKMPIPPLMKKVGVNGESVPVSNMINKSMFKSTGIPKIQKPKSKKK